MAKEFIVLDPDGEVTTPELKNIIENNGEYFDFLTKPSIPQETIIFPQLLEKQTSEQSSAIAQKDSPLDDDFELQITLIIQRLKELSEEEFERQIKDILPDSEHPEYLRYVRRVQAEILKNIKDSRKSLTECEISQSSMANISSEMNKLAILQDLVHQPQIERQIQKEPENNLIFVPAANGTPKILDDIESIDRSYYKKILDLVLSIRDNNFKKPRQFESKNYEAGLAEVRDKSTGARVLFARLDGNNYALIGTFIKDCDTDLAHRRELETASNLYRFSRNYLCNNLNNPEFLAQQQEYESLLFSKLSTPEKRTAYVKGGGSAWCWENVLKQEETG